jgi:hypothetical protein
LPITLINLTPLKVAIFIALIIQRNVDPIISLMVVICTKESSEELTVEITNGDGVVKFVSVILSTSYDAAVATGVINVTTKMKVICRTGEQILIYARFLVSAAM